MRKVYLLLTLLSLNVCLLSQEAFTNNGKVKIHAGASLGFFGDFQNNDTLIDQGSLISMTGIVGQIISGNSVTTFHNLKIDNSSTVGVILNKSVKVNASLSMDKGVMHTSSTNILIIGSIAVAQSTNDSSFVSGPVQKNGKEAFVFPLGRGKKYAPLSISASASSTNQFIAEYHNVNPDSLYNLNNKDTTLDHLSRCEYWLLTNPSGGSNVNVTLSWGLRSCGITDLSDLRVAEWNGTQWTDQGNGSITGTTAKGTVMSSSSVSNFGAYTLASSSIQNPLPINLLSFQADCDDNSNQLSWSTASEINNEYFSIEYSVNAEDWQVIGIVQGAGNSNSLRNYSFRHDNLLRPANSYYRLKQTDFNGQFEYSEVVGLYNCRGKLSEVISVYPNPNKGIFKVMYSPNDSQEGVMNVFNSMGELVGSFSGNQSIIDLSDRPSGIYFMFYNEASRTYVKKIIKE